MALKIKGTFVLIFFLLILGCDQGRVFEKNIEIQQETWHYKNQLVFNVAVDDTLAPHQFYFNLRHRNTYPYSNFYFFFYTTYPNGKTTKDTIQCPLADPSGRWYGSGISTVISNQILFKQNHFFKSQGNYQFTIEQAMREEEISGILDVGLRIEKK